MLSIIHQSLISFSHLCSRRKSRHLLVQVDAAARVSVRAGERSENPLTAGAADIRVFIFD